MVTYIKQYGIQRSCTNFVKLLLENNLERSIVLSNVLGWKHGPHKKEVNWNGDDWDPQNKKIETYLSLDELEEIKKAYKSNEIKYLICLKDPYAWLVSYSKYDNRPDKIRSLGGLLNESRKLMNRKKGVNRDKIPEYLEMWNKLHQNWMNLTDHSNCTYTKYENLLENPKEEVERLAKFFKTKTNNEFYVPEGRMKRGGEKIDKNNSTENKIFDSSYYIERRYLENFNEKMYETIRKHIDFEIVKKMKYDII